MKQRGVLKNDIRGHFRTKKIFALKNEVVEIISEKDNVLIVQHNKERFSITQKDILKL